jgi:hypothetical protein
MADATPNRGCRADQQDDHRDDGHQDGGRRAELVDVALRVLAREGGGGGRWLPIPVARHALGHGMGDLLDRL